MSAAMEERSDGGGHPKRRVVRARPRELAPQAGCNRLEAQRQLVEQPSRRSVPLVEREPGDRPLESLHRLSDRGRLAGSGRCDDLDERVLPYAPEELLGDPGSRDRVAEDPWHRVRLVLPDPCGMGPCHVFGRARGRHGLRSFIRIL
jgi:hypothetical protein